MRALRDYKYLIFDVDNTLLDFSCAYAKARENIAGKLGIQDSDEYRHLDDQCVWKAWKECGLENTEAQDVQENYHIYYYQYIVKHFFYLSQELGIVIDTDELVHCYLESIASSKVPMEQDTLQVYMELWECYKLVLATNGVGSIQKPRVSAFIPFTYKTYISEKVGYIKPSLKFFTSILQDLGCRAEDCLMIGDSMTNDMIGAKEAGMDVCWYNIKKKTKKEEVAVDYEIHGIAGLREILLR